jgi:tetratricopeptide (TPR) repeat protein
VGKKLPYPDLYTDMSEIYLDLALYEKAIEHAEKALQIKSNYAKAYFIKALVKERQQDLEEARAALAMCMKLKPSGKLLKMAEEAMVRLVSK